MNASKGKVDSSDKFKRDAMAQAWRKELILLPDIPGEPMLVDAINRRRAPRPTPFWGPFHIPGAPGFQQITAHVVKAHFQALDLPTTGLRIARHQVGYAID